MEGLERILGQAPVDVVRMGCLRGAITAVQLRSGRRRRSDREGRAPESRCRNERRKEQRGRDCQSTSKQRSIGEREPCAVALKADHFTMNGERD